MRILRGLPLFGRSGRGLLLLLEALPFGADLVAFALRLVALADEPIHALLGSRGDFLLGRRCRFVSGFFVFFVSYGFTCRLLYRRRCGFWGWRGWVIVLARPPVDIVDKDAGGHGGYPRWKGAGSCASCSSVHGSG